MRFRWQACLLVALLGEDGLVSQVSGQVTNYPASVKRTQWCSVPNYRYYRFTPTKVRGYALSDSLNCGLTTGKPDSCICSPSEASKCKSGYCVEDHLQVPRCTYPIVQVSEVEFYRSSVRVNTDVVPEHTHSAFRVVNAADVPRTWGIWELDFYNDTECTQRVTGGTPIASSQRARGFGHSVDWTAQNGSHDTARTYWQSTHEPPLERFELHGPVKFAFDGDLKTNWWPTCENPCRAGSQWLGLNFSTPVTGGVKCVLITQDRDRDYASYSLTVEGFRHGGDWETFSTFKAVAPIVKLGDGACQAADGKSLPAAFKNGITLATCSNVCAQDNFCLGFTWSALKVPVSAAKQFFRSDGECNLHPQKEDWVAAFVTKLGSGWANAASADRCTADCPIASANGNGAYECYEKKAGTWNWGGVVEKLSIPQGVAFIASTAHARTMDHNVDTSSVDLVGKPIVYDFGVETEIDSWRWATAEEPTENVAREHDGFTCDRDGMCPRDPIQWTLEGSLDNLVWVVLQNQATDFPTTTFRKRFVPYQPVVHQVALSIEDIWPDGNSQCAARR